MDLKVHIETERLLFRDLVDGDETNIFELDSDPVVQRYVGAKPLTTLLQAREVVAFIRQQYLDNGIGRWAVIEKEKGLFIGWGGLKYMRELTNNHIHYYDLGYRFMTRYWGQGYGTEVARAVVDHGFGRMQLSEIFAMTDARNQASRHVLEKAGLQDQGQFIHDGDLHNWFKISK